MELGELVNLPNGVLLPEWIASHTVSFFEHINLIYGTISEFCTMSGCSEMIGPNNKVYFWSDERGKRSKVPAPQYIDYVMTYMQKTLNDESIFPTKADKEFPSSFEAYARKIYRLLFHVLAHVYQSHFNEIVILDLHKHLNCIYVHLILFNQQFNLIEPKELEALNDLSIALKLLPDNQSEQMQIAISTTPEPPSSIDPYLTEASSNTNREQLTNEQQPTNHNHPHLDLQSSDNFNQENQQQQRKKYSRQHSYTVNQTISSPTTNYIKRFISSLSANNQTSASNQSCAIDEENNLTNNSNSPTHSNVTVMPTQSKSSFAIRNKLEQNELLNCDQENQHSEFPNSKKIVLNNLANSNKRVDADGKIQTSDSFGNLATSSFSKIHKYQHSTPIFFGSSFFTGRTKNSSNSQSAVDKTPAADLNDVQFNEKVIKENIKLLNSDQNNKSQDYPLGDNSLMNCNPSTQMSDSNSKLNQMEASLPFNRNTFDSQLEDADLGEPDERMDNSAKALNTNYPFGPLAINADEDEFENADSSQGSNHRTPLKNRRNVLVNR